MDVAPVDRPELQPSSNRCWDGVRRTAGRVAGSEGAEIVGAPAKGRAADGDSARVVIACSDRREGVTADDGNRGAHA